MIATTTKLSVLMAAMTIVGASTPSMAAAQEPNVGIERNNQNTQVINEEQEVCTTNESELVVSEDDVSSQFANVDGRESSDCVITETQITRSPSGSSTASVDGPSSNEFGILTELLADFF
jgi:hypothetical protein